MRPTPPPTAMPIMAPVERTGDEDEGEEGAEVAVKAVDNEDDADDVDVDNDGEEVEEEGEGEGVGLVDGVEDEEPLALNAVATDHAE